jgi:hypothetical protein
MILYPFLSLFLCFPYDGVDEKVMGSRRRWWMANHGVGVISSGEVVAELLVLLRPIPRHLRILGTAQLGKCERVSLLVALYL